jgi:nucleoid-associated protein YgaU
MSLRGKYTYGIQTAEKLWSGGSVEERDGKLFLKGTVKTQDEVNQIWNALKTIPEWNKEIIADIKATQASAPAAAQPSPSASTSRTYTVHAGDTLSAIAQRELGDAKKYMKIFEANRDQLQDPDKIKPGQVLKIPA